MLKHFPPPKKPEQYEQYNIVIRHTTPPEGTITRIDKDGETKIAMTPANVLKVQQLLRQAIAEGIKLGDGLQKVGKAAYFAMVKDAIQNATTNELLELKKTKERKANHAKGNWGNARVMNQEVIDQRKKDATDVFDEKRAQLAAKEWNKEERRLRALGPNIFAPPRPPATPRRRIPATFSPPASLLRPVSPPPRRRRMIVILPARVTTQELQQGRWAGQKQQQQEGQDRGQESSEKPQNQPMGRGQRVRKPRRASQ